MEGCLHGRDYPGCCCTSEVHVSSPESRWLLLRFKYLLALAHGMRSETLANGICRQDGGSCLFDLWDLHPSGWHLRECFSYHGHAEQLEELYDRSCLTLKEF
mmetsp:Transcript_125835/g.199445  ORF Transcript_125835/g.199445 Transcript_125835/m.199445 type:complete len:102 (+) Transcript_125835:566-871(+)